MDEQCRVCPEPLGRTFKLYRGMRFHYECFLSWEVKPIDVSNINEELQRLFASMEPNAED